MTSAALAQPAPTKHRRRAARLRHAAAGALLSALMALGGPGAVRAQSLLSDAETEKFLRDVNRPVLEAAGITPESVQYYIVADDNLNAFVALGQNIFVHTGLFTQTDNVGQVIGVMAHETGHISGGHIARRSEGATAPTAISLISMVLGVAAIAAGAGDAGMGIIAGGQQAAQRSFLSFSRVQEASADQAAATLLEQTGQSGRGLVETFRKFSTQEYLIGIPQDPYVRSHPLSSQRVARLENIVTASPYYDKPYGAEFVAAYDRIKAKIRGFMEKPETTLSRFPPHDKSVPARYARAYAYHKAVEIDKAMAEIDSLIAEDPDDPFYLELKGQLLLENGHVVDALAPLRDAVALLPDEPQIRTLLGRALIATEDTAFNDEAIKQLEIAAAQDPESPFTWHQLGVAYHIRGDEGMASLASAERAALSGDFMGLIGNARRASDVLEKGTPAWLRAQDLLVLAESRRGDFERSQRRRLGAN